MQKSIYPWQKNRNRGKMLRGARDLLKVKREKGKKSADRIFSYRHFLLLFLLPFKAYSWSHPRWWQSQSRLISQSE